MTLQYKLGPLQLSGPEMDLELVRNFMGEHGEALANAAARLGGSPAGGRVILLLEGLKTSRRLTRSLYRQLESLSAVLSLEHVGDPDRVESGFFAEFDPASRDAEGICLLSDALEELLCRIAEPKAPHGIDALSKHRGAA